MARAANKDEADFAVHYDKIKAEDYDYDLHQDLMTFTDKDDTYKLLTRVETFADGGVACDPNAVRNAEELGDVSKLNYQKSQSLRKKDGSADQRMMVIKSRDGQRFIALHIQPRSIWWVYPKGESVFWHSQFGSSKFYKNSFVKGCRQYDPAKRPDFRHWDQ